MKQVKDIDELKKILDSRQQENSMELASEVLNIINLVRKNKDQALMEFTEKFDHQRLENPAVSLQELESQAAKADPVFVQSLEEAADNIREYHELQKRKGYELKREDGTILGSRILPLDKVGLYVPGGRAQYPSSVLMNAIPAKIAGVNTVVMVTPPDVEGKIPPNLAAAAKVCGIDQIFKCGGAQAVAALAYGTESVPRVDKIVGPGNAYVAQAKRLVFGQVDIDMIAGPSEILVLADESANPVYVAADLISQAEHDPKASAILVTTSEQLADQVAEELKKQSSRLAKKEIIEKSLQDYGLMVIVNSLDEAIEAANQIAPEHLEVQTENPFEILERIKNAGSVFLGESSCESVGDYFAGVNHVLPTSGTARFSSPLGVDDFVKRSSYLYYPQDVLKKNADKIITLAKEENLDGHANAVEVRV